MSTSTLFPRPPSARLDVEDVSLGNIRPSQGKGVACVDREGRRKVADIVGRTPSPARTVGFVLGVVDPEDPY